LPQFELVDKDYGNVWDRELSARMLD